MLLGDAEKNRKFVVAKIALADEDRARLWELGVSVGTKAEKESASPFGATVITAGGTRIAIGKEAARGIEIEYE